jgi:ankyrin repeat protein
MSFQGNIDFSQYGLNWQIPANAVSMPDNFKENVSKVKSDDKKLIFTKPNGTIVNIVMEETLGRGSYGETRSIDIYKELDKYVDKNVPKVVKIIKFSNNSPEMVYDTIQEALIQILIYETSKDYKNAEINLFGPFCPKFYLLGREGATMFIVMERVTVNLDSILRNKEKEGTPTHVSWRPPTSAFVRQTILQLTTILKELYVKIGYNHRDLKADNIMFNIVNGEPNLKLIDFGFSCLKYKNLILKSIYSRAPSTLYLKYCDSETRDLHTFFYYFCNHTYYYNVSCPLKRVIKALMSSYKDEVDTWGSTYEIYNRRNRDSSDVRPLNLSLDTVYKIFRDIKFSKANNSCTPINKDWVIHLVKLYTNMLPYINKEEYKAITDSVKEPFLKGYFSRDIDFLTNSSPEQLITEVKYIINLSDGPYEDKTELALKFLQDKLIKNSQYIPKYFDGTTLLHKAVKAGDTPLVDRILETGGIYLLNIQDEKNINPLDIAITNNNIELQNKLFDKGAFTNFYSVDYIYRNDDKINIIERNPKIFTRLKGGNLLNYLIENNDIENVLILYKLKLPVYLPTFYFCLAHITNIDLLNKLWNTYKEDVEINNLSSSHGSMTPLMYAAEKGNYEYIKLLLSHPKIITSAKDSLGNTCLHYAVKTYVGALSDSGQKQKDAFEIIKLLIEANPALADIKDNRGRGPGNPFHAKNSEARAYIKSKKSTLFTKRENTNRGKLPATKGGRNGFRRKTRSKRTIK